jgi:hypothetical protein
VNKSAIRQEIETRISATLEWYTRGAAWAEETKKNIEDNIAGVLLGIAEKYGLRKLPPLYVTFRDGIVQVSRVQLE